jgi:hypothetical protein
MNANHLQTPQSLKRSRTEEEQEDDILETFRRKSRLFDKDSNSRCAQTFHLPPTESRQMVNHSGQSRSVLRTVIGASIKWGSG